MWQRGIWIQGDFQDHIDLMGSSYTPNLNLNLNNQA